MTANDTSAHGPSPEPLLLLCHTPARNNLLHRLFTRWFNEVLQHLPHSVPPVMIEQLKRSGQFTLFQGVGNRAMLRD